MLTAALVLAALAAAPAADPNLAKARAEIANLHYDKADAALAQTLATPKLDRATRLQALQLQGEVKAFMGKGAESTQAFEQLLYLEPSAAADPNWSPKVSDRFNEAKAWAGQHPALSAEPGPPLADKGQVKAVTLLVHDEGLHLAKSARITAAGKSAVVPVPEDGKVVAPVTPAPEVPWTAELLSADDSPLLTLGDEAKPLVSTAPAPVVMATAEAPSSNGNLRTAGYVAGGVGAACLVGSAVMASMASSDRSTLRDATRDSSGRITSLGQAQYTDLYNRSNSRMTTAAVLGGVGAVALASGVALWFYGKPVAVTPTANGAAVVGSLP